MRSARTVHDVKWLLTRDRQQSGQSVLLEVVLLLRIHVGVRRQQRWKAIIRTLLYFAGLCSLVHTYNSFRTRECATRIVMTHLKTSLHLLTFDSNDNTCGEHDRICPLNLVAVIFYPDNLLKRVFCQMLVKKAPNLMQTLLYQRRCQQIVSRNLTISNLPTYRDSKSSPNTELAGYLATVCCHQTALRKLLARFLALICYQIVSACFASKSTS